LAVRGIKTGNHAATLLGLGLGVLSLTLFITVNALGWSPAEARHPFAVVSAVVGCLTMVLTLLAVLEPRSPRDVPALAALRHSTDVER